MSNDVKDLREAAIGALALIGTFLDSCKMARSSSPVYMKLISAIDKTAGIDYSGTNKLCPSCEEIKIMNQLVDEGLMTSSIKPEFRKAVHAVLKEAGVLTANERIRAEIKKQIEAMMAHDPFTRETVREVVKQHQEERTASTQKVEVIVRGNPSIDEACQAADRFLMRFGNLRGLKYSGGHRIDRGEYLIVKNIPVDDLSSAMMGFANAYHIAAIKGFKLIDERTAEAVTLSPTAERADFWRQLKIRLLGHPDKDLSQFQKTRIEAETIENCITRIRENARSVKEGYNNHSFHAVTKQNVEVLMGYFREVTK